MKVPNKRELQQTAINHSSDIDFKDFMSIYKKYNGKKYSFFVNDITLSLDIRYDLEKIFWNIYLINHDNGWSDYRWKTTIWY